MLVLQKPEGSIITFHGILYAVQGRSRLTLPKESPTSNIFAKSDSPLKPAVLTH